MAEEGEWTVVSRGGGGKRKKGEGRGLGEVRTMTGEVLDDDID